MRQMSKSMFDFRQIAHIVGDTDVSPLYRTPKLPRLWDEQEEELNSSKERLLVHPAVSK